MKSQQEDGSSGQRYFTRTAFPRDLLLRYHMYRSHFSQGSRGERLGGLLQADGEAEG